MSSQRRFCAIPLTAWLLAPTNAFRSGLFICSLSHPHLPSVDIYVTSDVPRKTWDSYSRGSNANTDASEHLCHNCSTALILSNEIFTPWTSSLANRRQCNANPLQVSLRALGRMEQNIRSEVYFLLRSRLTADNRPNLFIGSTRTAGGRAQYPQGSGGSIGRVEPNSWSGYLMLMGKQPSERRSSIYSDRPRLVMVNEIYTPGLLLVSIGYGDMLVSL